jgi:hypothetical protein
MNKQKIIKLISPKSGFSDLLGVYLNWAGVGFISVFIAEQLDNYSGVSYAAFFTNSVNAAIGFKFWVLITIIGLLLYCLCLPVVYIAQRTPQLLSTSQKLRYFTYTFFLVAFDEGALMIGILFANLIHTSERVALITSKTFLFTEASIFTIAALIIGNSILWLMGESLYNQIDKSYSGLVDAAVKSPLKYSLPGYLVLSLTFIMIVINQS